MKFLRPLSVCSSMVFLITFSLAAPTAAAQSQATGADLQGTILDPDGAPLPGVTITVTHEETGLTRTTTTNPSGYFRVPLLRPGTYTIQAALSGFQTVERPAIVLKIGSVVEIDLTLSLARVEETLIVTAEAPIVETSKTNVSTVIDENSIDSLPILGRDFSDFTLLTPGTLIEGGRGTVSIGGQRGVNTSVNIDGTSDNSAFFGYQRGGTDSPFTISLESVREFQVVTSGVMPEFGRSGGGLVNVVTKSGTNAWRGGGHLFLRDDSLVGNDPFGREQASFSVQQFGGNVGGPLARNQSFLFASSDFQLFDTPFFVDFRTSDTEFSQLQTLLNNSGFSDLNISQDRFTRTNDAQVYFVKWDHAINEDHHLSIRNNFSFHETVNGGTTTSLTGTTGQSESNLGNQNENTDAFVVQLTSLFGDNAFNELRFQYANDDLDRTPNDPIGPETQINSPFLRFGRRFFLPIIVREDKYQIQDNFSYLFGNHDLKVGFDLETDKTAEFFAGFAAGHFRFSRLSTFLAGGEPSFILQFFGNTNFPNFSVRQTATAAYFQDSWRATPKLTVNYGVRWEGTFNPTPPGNPARPLTEQIPDDLNNIQPRLGLAFAPDPKTVLRLSGGFFNSRTPTLLFFNPFNSNGTAGEGIFFIPCFLSSITCTWPNIFSSPPVGQGDQEIFFFDPDFEEAQTLRINGGFEREIFEDLSLGASFVYSRVNGLQRLIDTNLAPGSVDEFGRLIYLNDGRGPIRPEPGVLLKRDEDTGFSHYKAFIFEFKKRFSHGYGFFGSYTLARDADNDSNERSAGGVQPSNIFDNRADFGDSARDTRHRVVVSGFVDLPYGFRVSGIFVGRSGRPFNATLRDDV
ncbi:MAG: TonB-dependent receptor domain-containing protein, partial [Acidobacteriota bacterium]